MEDTKTIEQRVVDAILERKTSIEIAGDTYEVAQPSIATVILASEVISRFPIVPKEVKDSKDVTLSVLHYAKDFNALGELAAILILGAKNLTEEVTETITEKKFFGLWRKKHTETKIVDKKYVLAKHLLENMRPSTLFEIVTKRLDMLEIGAFFAVTTSLSEANILKPTKEVE